MKNNEFVPIDLQKTMISSKLVHCNDTVLVRKELAKKRILNGSFSVIAPRGAPTTVGKYIIASKKDFKRSSFGLFTDHFPVVATFCADELPEGKALTFD